MQSYGGARLGLADADAAISMLNEAIEAPTTLHRRNVLVSAKMTIDTQLGDFPGADGEWVERTPSQRKAATSHVLRAMPPVGWPRTSATQHPQLR